MKASARVAAASAVIAILVLAPGAPASAHPLGNFTVNRAAALTLSPGRLEVAYVVDHAEIPTQQAFPDLDVDRDGTASPGELRSWAARSARGVVRELRATVDGAAVPLRVGCATAVTGEGQGGLPLLRLEVGLTGSIPESGTLAWSDRTEPARLGWREVTARGAAGVALAGSTVPVVSPSDGLRAYPQDLLADPVDVREARVAYGPGAGRAVEAAATSRCAGAAPAPASSRGGFLGLLDREGTPLLVAVALALAVGFGAVHALGPGHGKALIAGTVVGSGARARQAIAVGVAVSAMHTASVLALGVLVLGLERTFRPEQVYPVLGLASGVTALGLGAWLFVRRVGAWAALPGTHRARSTSHDHAHGHGPGGHVHGSPDAPILSRRGLTALAVAGGILPSPTALVVLLSAISLGRVAFGLALIAAFSVGLAAALVGVGLVTIRARDALAHRMLPRLGPVGRLAPVASSAAVVVAGAVLTVRGIAGL